VPWLAHAGLALSVSLGACANALALYLGLRRRGVYTPRPGWMRFALRLLLALAVFAGALWLAQRGIDWTALQPAPWRRAGLLAALVTGAAAVYFAALAVLGFRPRDFLQPRGS
jgi:putative peptidoglycan lipid II flippase